MTVDRHTRARQPSSGTARARGALALARGHGGIRIYPEPCLPPERSRREPAQALPPLLELPVERVLVSHGEPVLGNGREALACALDRP